MQEKTCYCAAMSPKKLTKDPLNHQLPVRFSDPDWHLLDEMQREMHVDRSEIIRWAVQHFHKIAQAHEWNLTTRGEFIRHHPQESDISAAPPPRAKATPR